MRNIHEILEREQVHHAYENSGKEGGLFQGMKTIALCPPRCVQHNIGRILNRQNPADLVYQIYEVPKRRD